MKKLLYLFVAVCISATASAQKLTDKDIQGTWKLAALEASGMVIDVVKEKVTLPPETEAMLTEEQKAEMNAGMAQAMEMFRESFAKIEGKNLTQNLGPEEQKGTFVMAQKEGKNVITLTQEDGTTKEIIVSIVDKKLRLEENEGGAAAVFVYTKQ
jgi:hypothetical protein